MRTAVCPCCGRVGLMDQFTVAGDELVYRCSNHHVVRRQRLEQGHAHNRLDTWIRSLETSDKVGSVPAY